MKTISKYIFILVISLFTVACTKTIEQDQIYLSHSSFTFASIGENLEIGVDANVAWEVVNELDWITVEDKSDTSVVFTALANDSDQSRSGVVKFVAGNAIKLLNVSQIGRSFSGKFVDINGLTNIVFSRNGRYYAGLRFEYLSDGYTAVYYPTIVDTYTGEVRELGQTSSNTPISIISNDGQTFVRGNVIYDNDGETEVEMSGYFNVSLTAMSSDKSVIVGYAQEDATRLYVPVKWTNLQPEVLEIPDLNARGDALRAGAMARGCSDDGSVVFGSEWDSFGLLYWKNGQMFFPGKEYCEKKTVLIESMFGIIESDVYCLITKTAEAFGISPNGKYITAGYNDYRENGDQPAIELSYAVVIDTETNDVHFIKSETIDQLVGLTVDDEGICYGGTPAYGISEGYVMDYSISSIDAVSDWMQGKYGIAVDQDRVISGVTSDGNVIYGLKPVQTLLGVQYNSWYYIVDPEKK